MGVTSPQPIEDDQLDPQVSSHAQEIKPVVVSVFFGTQTGNAEELAHELSGLLDEHGVAHRVCDLDDFSPVIYIYIYIYIFIQSLFAAHP